MKLKNIKLISCVALALAGCAQNTSDPRSTLRSDAEIVKAKATASIHPTQKYILGQVQVELANEELLSAVIEDMSAKHGVNLSLLDKIPGEPIYLLEINSTTPVDDVIKTLSGDYRVAMAGRNNHMQAEAFRTNDPLGSTQWALNNRGQEAPRALAGKVGADIGMDGVAAEGSHDVVVAIIDTGVDYFHEDLAITEEVDGHTIVRPGSNIWINTGEIPNNDINDDNNGDETHGIQYVDDVYGYDFVGRKGDPRDDHGHGTHVAGVIGALRNNFKGIAGINQKVSIMGLKFLSAEGGGSDFDAQLALYYVMNMQKRFPNKRFITSNSWGSAGRPSTTGDKGDFLLKAFAKASKAGILNIAAAGNDSSSNRFAPHYPSNYSAQLDSFLSVAATNNLDQLASFSSYGYELVQIAAPGVLIMSTVPEYLFGHGYEAWSGTSMATPQVSGAAALLWSQNMNASSAEIKQRLMDTTDTLPQLHGSLIGAGRLNVKKALANARNKAPREVAREIAYRLESRRASPDKTYDVLDKIEYKGAKEIQVCFERITLEPDMDWLEVMSADYRVRDMMTGRYEDTDWEDKQSDLCAAPVLGETVYLRLVKNGNPEGIPGYVVKSLKVRMPEVEATTSPVQAPVQEAKEQPKEDGKN